MRKVARLVRRTVQPVFSSVARTVRREDPRRLYWSVYYPFNFGDWIGPYLYLAITGREPLFTLPSNYATSTVYLAAGSILGLARENCIVWGSGILSRSVTFPRPTRIAAVRGPHTREKALSLGYDCPEVFGDPGILLPQVYPASAGSPEWPLGLLPHFRELEETKRTFRRHESITVIDVRLPIEEVAKQITCCQRIASSSLHGLVLGHAYHVPSGWASFGGKARGDGVKFLDHYESMGVSNPPHLADGLSRKPEEIMDFVDAQAQPSPDPLVEPLMRACPFPRAKESSSPASEEGGE